MTGAKPPCPEKKNFSIWSATPEAIAEVSKLAHSSATGRHPAKVCLGLARAASKMRNTRFFGLSRPDHFAYTIRYSPHVERSLGMRSNRLTMAMGTK